ncbi:Zinc finger protein [Wickerhamomyces ciferrii]|uniref:Zinc finger protein n=1 Tax=Wickerhamomyces ciferrii (strain ATCC 14091 / BCRC 22168 / CBS 111 / JCM 3599 / NBRC 0793 / NRRL Y-1031 F-60-10) TaxID=1206466 RepID=K0KES9_WICCF|nr:Zinc finger protein [Wickerhamomyces ciferrii]CCH40722.1 Zinc finger protein [Wickerhamomyces ciferrii]
MISPRSQENQYNYHQQQQAAPGSGPTSQSGVPSSIPPPTSLPNPQSSFPLYNNNGGGSNGSGINTNSSTPTTNGVSIGGSNSSIPTSGPGSTAGFNLTYNNNYTTTNPLPPSSNSSFSLPSVPQAVYYDQQQQQQHPNAQIPPLPLQAGPSAPLENGQGGPPQQVFYYQQPFFQPAPPTNGVSQPLIAPPSQDFNQYQQQLQFPAHDQHQIPPPPQPTLPQANGVQNTLPIPVPSNEELPFPGVLDPNAYQQHIHARSQSTSSNPSFTGYHPRSNTYPTLDNKTINPKNNRQSLTSSSLLGMTPETARRNRCTICQKQFKRPSSLQTHSYSHTGEKPFACSWENCGRLFSVRSNMIRHRKLHERDAKLKSGSISSTGSGFEEEDKEHLIQQHQQAQQVQQQQTHVTNGNGTTDSNGLPNLLHPNNGQSNPPPSGEFQLGYFS